MPVDLVGRGVAVELAAGVEESLDGGGVDVVHGGEVEHDGLERRQVAVVFELAPLASSVPRAVANLSEKRRIGSARGLEDHCGEVVEVARGVGVVETFSEAVDEDTGVWVVDHDLRVGTILMLDGQETRAKREVLLILGDSLLGLSLSVRAGGLSAVGLPNSADASAAQEPSLAEEQAPNEDNKRSADGDIDTILNVGEDSDEDTSKEDDDLMGSNTPELEDGLGRGDDITDGVDNDGGESRVGNVEEEGCQGIECEQDDNGSDDTSKRGADTSLGLDGSTGERSSGRVGAQERSQDVGNSNGDELLRRVDNVVVNATERLGDGNVLDKHDDDGSRKLVDEGANDVGVDLGGTCMLEATGDGADKIQVLVVLLLDDNTSSNSGVQEDGEGSAKSRDDEPHLGTVRLLLGHERAEGAEGIEQEEGGQAQGGIDAGVGQALQGINDDQVSTASSGVDVGDTHKLGDLASQNVDGRASHEGADGGQGDELDNPSQAGKTEEQDDAASDESQRRGNDVAWDIGRPFCDGEDDISSDLGHDCDRLFCLAISVCNT